MLRVARICAANNSISFPDHAFVCSAVKIATLVQPVEPRAANPQNKDRADSSRKSRGREGGLK